MFQIDQRQLPDKYEPLTLKKNKLRKPRHQYKGTTHFELFQLTKIENLNKSKVPIVPIDKRLEKYRGKVLFPKKLAKANSILAKAGLPKLAK